MSGSGYPTGRTVAPRPPRQTFREQLWEYLGHPEDETPERRRVLYALVVLRLGLGSMFLLRGWAVIFAAPPDAFAARLGDPARWGLGGLATDTVLFILGCTELGIGLLLLAGAFTRVSAVVGAVLLALALVFGYFPVMIQCFDSCNASSARGLFWNQTARATLLLLLGGLLPIIMCGSPFLSADRALDKLEEEERDRAPATLPPAAKVAPLFLRSGFAAAICWLGVFYAIWHRPAGLALAIGVAVLLIFGLGVRATLVLITLAVLVSLARGVAAPLSVDLSDVGVGDWLAIVATGGALLITGAGGLSIDGLLSRRVALARAGVRRRGTLTPPPAGGTPLPIRGEGEEREA